MHNTGRECKCLPRRSPLGYSRQVFKMCFFLAVSYEHVLLSKNNNNDRKAIGGLPIKKGPGAPRLSWGGWFLSLDCFASSSPGATAFLSLLENQIFLFCSLLTNGAPHHTSLHIYRSSFSSLFSSSLGLLLFGLFYVYD